MPRCEFHYKDYICYREDLIDLMISKFPLALIISEQNGFLHTSHVPLFRSSNRQLFGHVDRNNPQFNSNQKFTARLVFMGPDKYIPPEAYKNRFLPTWNYVSVHMDATINVIDNVEYSLKTLKNTAAILQPVTAPFQFDKEDSRIISGAAHILCLEIDSQYEEGRFKLSQDKSSLDQDAALNWLLTTDSTMLRDLMQILMNFSKKDNELLF
jgi:transcriptional regulator